MIDKALVIIQKTNDGDDLSPMHLKLVEMACNNHLNERGEEAFEKLYQNVLSGYQQPFHLGVKGITYDQAGYIYWEGKRVEHFSDSYAYTEDARQYCQELASRYRCRAGRPEIEDHNEYSTEWLSNL